MIVQVNYQQPLQGNSVRRISDSTYLYVELGCARLGRRPIHRG